MTFPVVAIVIPLKKVNRDLRLKNRGYKAGPGG